MPAPEWSRLLYGGSRYQRVHSAVWSGLSGRDGSRQLAHWLDDAGRIGLLEHIDRILIGNVFEAAFDSTTDQSPSLIFKDGQILRNTRALNALPFQEGQRGIHPSSSTETAHSALGAMC